VGGTCRRPRSSTTTVPAARSPSRWKWRDAAIANAPGKNGGAASTARMRFRSTACAALIDSPVRETTRRPRTDLPSVCPLFTASRTAPYPHHTANSATSMSPTGASTAKPRSTAVTTTPSPSTAITRPSRKRAIARNAGPASRNWKATFSGVSTTSVVSSGAASTAATGPLASDMVAASGGPVALPGSGA